MVRWPAIPIVLPWPGNAGLGVVARALLQARGVGALDDDVVDVDARDLDPADPLAGLDRVGEQVGELCDLLLVVVGVRATDPLDLRVGSRNDCSSRSS